MFVLKSLFQMSVVSLSLFAFSEELSKVDSEALQKTMELLQDPSKRQSFIDNNPQAQQTDKMVRQLTGDGKNMDQIYKIAAQIMQSMTQNAGGDSATMEKVMEKAQQDPESFYRGLSSEQQKMIQELGGQLDKSRLPNH